MLQNLANIEYITATKNIFDFKQKSYTYLFSLFCSVFISLLLSLIYKRVFDMNLLHSGDVE
jgi:hypothetical protein